VILGSDRKICDVCLGCHAETRYSQAFLKEARRFSLKDVPLSGTKGGFLNTIISGFQSGVTPPGRIARGSFMLMVFVSLFGCSGPMLVTEYDDGMETGQETVVYDDKGHPQITSETGYVVDPYAESDSIEKEDFQRQMPGVVPD
jgi:hypothetical protein